LKQGDVPQALSVSGRAQGKKKGPCQSRTGALHEALGAVRYQLPQPPEPQEPELQPPPPPTGLVEVIEKPER